MQPTPGGSAGSSSGGATSKLSGSGLTRFRSAPPTWLEQLLEEDEDAPLKPGHSFTQILTACSASRGSALFGSSEDPLLFEPSGFQRQNSSPADFLGNSGFSSFEIPENYDYFPSDIDLNPGSKRPREGNLQYSSAKFQTQLKGEEMAHVTTNISSSADAGMEKLLEESVPCRVRAKRGCATHPRSIAERVRRTRISDRIRKLQELVPNMDKQTNTADMLDEALEYVKTLKRQIQELTELERKCKCKVKEEGV